MARTFSKLLEIIKGSHDNTVYDDAIAACNRAENAIRSIHTSFTDFKSINFNVIKNTWNDLPSNVSQGVSTMGLHLSDEYRSALVYYSPNAYVAPHMHSTEWEVIKILEGSAHDSISKVTLTKGDVYVIPKGVNHHVTSDDAGCYMYVLFTSHKEHLKIPHKEPNTALEFIEEYKHGIAKKL